MKPARFGYVAPHSVPEAIEALRAYGDDSKLLAGGQSLGPLLNLRLARPDVLIDLGPVAGLGGAPRDDGDRITIPAMSAQRAVELSPLARQHCPLLAEALPSIAHRTIRNRGTIGGSLAHADPAAEIPAVAVVSDATVVVQGPAGERRIPAASFFLGFFTTALEPTELVTAAEFPKPAAGQGSCWAEFAPRRGDFAIAGVAAQVRLAADGDIGWAAIVCSGVADRPWRADAAQARLVGQRPAPRLLTDVADMVAAQCRPADDFVAAADYRKNLLRHLTLTKALERAAVTSP
jgi:carbon-monoxide dehydrogenase medium subunit